MLVFYNILLSAAALFLVPWYAVRMMQTGKYRRGFRQRLGFLPPTTLAGLTGSPRLWFHAVSVGEVTVAASIIAALRKRLPGAAIILSTTTDTGQEMAHRIVTAADAFIYYPLDIPCAVRRAIDAIRPDIFVLTETELWPNFIRSCRARRIPVLMANGRLSPRSFRRYRLTRFFWKGLLGAFAGLGTISELDAERFRSLGAPAGKVKVCGNAKYDSLAAQTSANLLTEMQSRLNIKAGDTVLVAGSTHEGEEAIIIAVYGKLLHTYPGCKLIIVPRHIERTPSVLTLAREAGFSDLITMSEISGGRQRRDERLIVVDVIGELFKVYGLATVVFCGGSLVAKGGQNIMEAAAWGKVIFYGPFMDDFREERTLLETIGVGITVRNGDELLEGILKMMADPSAMALRGEAGRRLVAANSGAADRYADLIIKCL
jgi:3-deoxy-D-manno-octulosonic-acid transferase